MFQFHLLTPEWHTTSTQIIAAVARPGGTRFYLRGAVDTAALTGAEDATIRLMRAAQGAAIVDLDHDHPPPVTPAPARTDLLAGGRVMMGHCNGEDPTIIRDWLDWHQTRHGADGALIIDRAPPRLARRRAARLRQMLRTDDRLRDLRVVVVSCAAPLGVDGMGPQAHPFFAPDAPCKDRMTPPAADPWASVLGFWPIFDLMRALFLADAAAVAHTEIHDLIARVNGNTVFDAALTAPEGIIGLVGQRVYPWDLRDRAGFGDHICRRFDSDAREGRWCAVPAALPPDAVWLVRRIVGAAPPRRHLPFWRCMALRHQGAKISQIVPKSSLIPDATLSDLARDLGARPVPVPVAATATTAPDQRRVCIVTTMKNEGPFILEWLAWHRVIGVRDVLVYTNDCTDGTDDLLRLLQDRGLCQWRDNPWRDLQMKPQHAALEQANTEPCVTGADWLICMDVDEFIAVHAGDGTLAALFDAVPDANVISMTWRLFGNGGIDDFADAMVTQHFTQCARASSPKPHQAWGFKTLFRNDGLFRKLGVHRPKGLQPGAVDRIRWVNGSGDPMPPDQWRTAWRSHSGTVGYDLVTLNHYAVRSTDSFLVKRDRGRVNHVNRDQGAAYWFRMNHNVVTDTRARRMAARVAAEYDRLLADPVVAAAHRACVAAHRARIHDLKQMPKYRDFYDELTSPRMQKLARLHGHFGSAVYLQGPHCIPDDVVARDPDDAFFFTVDDPGDAQH
ncbi:glycosyltransferase family 2 protein [Paracoccus sp. (in: a-proteobacteria)]|uniref:glycosyltransferase family 2 protein n=1 Tax=Paracoccus sp. TaxID=267 RepID=UPI0026DF80CA|nr:glycosyltransferase family 2 protein [Paracoccus sp. (in: a-proteobacteria)]MDO5647483.1 glycosyltransferase family 2 protein [Paracoccus sp. (in: a-proteobacteria)]